jgi:hypothetical protein
VTVAAIATEFEQNKITITGAPLVCLAVWGLATGIGLLSLRPWRDSRVWSSMVFSVFPERCRSLSSSLTF